MQKVFSAWWWILQPQVNNQFFFQCLLSIHWKPGSLGHTTKIKGSLPCSWSRGLVPRPVNIWNETKQSKTEAHLHGASFGLRRQEKIKPIMPAGANWSPAVSSEAVACQAPPGMNQGVLLFRNRVPGDLKSNSGSHRLSQCLPIWVVELTGTLGNLCITATLPAIHGVGDDSLVPYSWIS